MQIEKQYSFDVPEGTFRARLHSVREIKDGGIRIVFDELGPLRGYLNFMAGKSYKAKESKKLAEDLSSWLGKEFDTLLEKNKGVVTVRDLEAYIGRGADLQIELWESATHADPYRFIKRITPPGGLVSEGYLEEAA